MSDHFQRMIQLVTSFFDTRNDPEQLDVDQAIIEQLRKIHPATMSEYVEGDGPVVWILMIPTTYEVMRQFIKGDISEKGLYEETKPGQIYEAIYLCSASVLEEYRKKGLAKKVSVEAINKIRKDHPIKALYYWPFSEEGKALAESIAKATELPLYEKKEGH